MSRGSEDMPKILSRGFEDMPKIMSRGYEGAHTAALVSLPKPLFMDRAVNPLGICKESRIEPHRSPYST
jgi:hypothetical protein